jgi:hypothetical protein
MKKNLFPFLSAGLLFIISACSKDDNPTPNATGSYNRFVCVE